MSNVWVCFPSKRPLEELDPALVRWKKQGYNTAICRDEGEHYRGVNCDIAETLLPYPGYAAAVNHLACLVLRVDHTCEWLVAASDDIWPDPNKRAQEIAEECSKHFRALHYGNESHHAAEVGPLATFGVMQPTSDTWGDKSGPYIQRVAGSPWLGRSFCERANGGNGPLWPEYRHMHVDEHLQLYAQHLGIFWQRPDLLHYHAHWGRPLPGEKFAPADRMPEFLKHANSTEEWKRGQSILERHKQNGFKECRPL